jgi:hypothetical protein
MIGLWSILRQLFRCEKGKGCIIKKGKGDALLRREEEIIKK